MPKVIVSFNRCERIHNQTSKKLHTNYCINKKQHSHQHTDVGKSLRKGCCNWVSFSITYFERLNKGIKKDSNANTTAQQFDQPGSSE